MNLLSVGADFRTDLINYRGYIGVLDNLEAAESFLINHEYGETLFLQNQRRYIFWEQQDDVNCSFLSSEERVFYLSYFSYTAVNSSTDIDDLNKRIFIFIHHKLTFNTRTCMYKLIRFNYGLNNFNCPGLSFKYIQDVFNFIETAELRNMQMAHYNPLHIWVSMHFILKPFNRFNNLDKNKKKTVLSLRKMSWFILKKYCKKRFELVKKLLPDHFVEMMITEN
jgi:hypothetical protein